MSKRDDIALTKSRQRGFGESAAAPAGVAARIRAARNLRRTIKWPGTDIEIGLKVLSQGEVDQAHVAARLALDAAGVDQSKPAAGLIDSDIVGAAVWLQTLARALYESAAPDAPLLYETADEFAATVTPDELHALTDEYEAHENHIASLGDLPDHVFEEFVEAAKKKDSIRLNSIVGAMPQRWLRSTAVRLATSQNSSSSNHSSSPPSADDETSPLSPASSV